MPNLPLVCAETGPEFEGRRIRPGPTVRRLKPERHHQRPAFPIKAYHRLATVKIAKVSPYFRASASIDR